MKRFSLLLVLTLMLTGLFGCYKDMIIVDKNYNASNRNPTHSQVKVDILGLFNLTPDIDISSMCQDGPGIVQVETLFSIILFNVRKASIYCK